MNQKHDILNKTIELLMRKAFPFVLYHQPGEEDICVVAQSREVDVVCDVNKLCNSKGFLISAFESVRTGEAFFIQDELIAGSEIEYNKLFERIKQKPSLKTSVNGCSFYEMGREEYLEMTERVVHMLRNKELDKVVLSRVVSKSVDKEFDLVEFFMRLAGKYRDAFVYLFNLPGKGLWIGATPETLIRRNKKGEAVIMSLAGTIPVTNKEEVVWGEKEIVEQQYVSEYIRLRLTELGVNDFSEEPVKTVFAGNLAHLQTIFKVSADDLNKQFGNLVKGLHPTPAVCGLPKTDAFQVIKYAEPYNRSFYTGYLGPWRIREETNLYVNLRCAKITSEKINLFVGGGLTADSIPEKEWEETEHKAKTLLSVLAEMKRG